MWIWITCAYLSGSIPYGLLFSYLFAKVDVRSLGSGNIGATNVLRTGHKGIALATLLCDVLKGLIPVCIARLYQMDEISLMIIGYAAIIGHVLPIWLKFKGGKGVATAIGVFCGLSPILGALTALIWLLSTQILKVSSLAALSAFIGSPFIAYFLTKNLTYFCLCVLILILITHRSNIQRLISGQGDIPLN